MHGHGVCLIKLHQTVLTHKTGLNCTLFHYRTSKLNTDNITIITLERSDTFIAASSFSFLLVILEQQVPNQIYHSLTLCQKSIWGKLSDDCLMGIYIWVTYQRGSPHPLSKTPKLPCNKTAWPAPAHIRTRHKLWESYFWSRMPVETKQELLLAMAVYGLDQNSTFGLPPLNTDKRGADDAWDVDNNKFTQDRSHVPTCNTRGFYTTDTWKSKT